MALFGISLQNASSSGAGQAVFPDYPIMAENVSMSIFVSGGSGVNVDISFEGTPDGEQWLTLGTGVLGVNSSVQMLNVANGGQSNSLKQYVFIGFRANITSISGTSPSVTSTIAIMPH